MNIKPWSPMPIDWIRDGRIKQFDWKVDGSSGTAALELFYVICHFATERGPRVREYNGKLQPVVTASPVNPYAAHLGGGEPVTPASNFVQAALGQVSAEVPTPEIAAPDPVAHLTYDDFAALAGLSRNSVAKGLALLEERAMIARPGSARSSEYALLGLTGRQFAKLPGQALLSPAKTSFFSLTRFHLRSRHELEALKLLFYYASIRSRADFCSEAKYETIWQHTGVPERHIPSANALLIEVDLLSRIERGASDEVPGGRPGANRYYLRGYRSLGMPARASTEVQGARKLSA
ncbi:MULTISPECIES: hypothetical protein [pseudomallei group]|uniref:hypothetical protein n=1 Tax=pseudomallei group TaxID=111527 RepID=UPI000531F498|nr:MULTISPECIES: hypothetical protein [pseudomallei group]KGS88293.1 hypothetical protein X942_2099 [Burkholderia pseudomallei MSHR5596]WRS65392.1 hypothetical protein U9S59_15360 [Burkholderia thailandensis]CAK1282359.1 Uncharacterised protein [Burkholderia pseudomallei]